MIYLKYVCKINEILRRRRLNLILSSSSSVCVRNYTCVCDVCASNELAIVVGLITNHGPFVIVSLSLGMFSSI